MRKLPGVINAQQFSIEVICEIFSLARFMRKTAPTGLLAGKILCSIFYEPSTRTRISFEIAMTQLGGAVISTENAREFSSAAKGEKLEHTMRVISGYNPDVIILRYDAQGGAEIARKYSKVPIINAGDGDGQHPTQGLLDLFTIGEYYPSNEELVIALVGDLRCGRTVRSLCYLLPKCYRKIRIYLVSPSQLRMKDDIKNYLSGRRVYFEETEDFEGVLRKVNIVYLTRVQVERHEKNELLKRALEKVAPNFRMTWERAEMMQKDAIIMHPLPINDEVDLEVDKNHRAVWFRQSDNGLPLRKALLVMTINGY
jgi:aspartate carbamoyltransferase catalytic subunit